MIASECKRLISKSQFCSNIDVVVCNSHYKLTISRVISCVGWSVVNEWRSSYINSDTGSCRVYNRKSIILRSRISQTRICNLSLEVIARAGEGECVSIDLNTIFFNCNAISKCRNKCVSILITWTRSTNINFKCICSCIRNNQPSSSSRICRTRIRMISGITILSAIKCQTTNFDVDSLAISNSMTSLGNLNDTCCRIICCTSRSKLTTICQVVLSDTHSQQTCLGIISSTCRTESLTRNNQFRISLSHQINCF